MLKVLLAGGGTGGHINPALSIAEIIKEHRPDAEFLFAGTPNGMEAKLVPLSGYKLETIKIAGFQRKLSLKNIKRNIKALWYLSTSSKRAKQIIRGFNPDIAIGTGGYVAGPVIRMAAKMGIPTVIHEQNAYPGVTNKLLAKTASYVMLTVEDALKYMEIKCPYKITGLPVRKGINSISKEEARKKLGINSDFTVLSFGGSLGAGCINDVMDYIIKKDYKENLPINHIHGFGGMGRNTFAQSMERAGVPLKSERFRISEYINDMDVCLAAADLCICRSGASTLAEIESAAIPSILIPSPNVAGNHQYYNAKVLSDSGAAITIEQKDVTKEKIDDILTDFLNNPQKLKKMSENCKKIAVNDTNDKIWEVISEVLKKAGK